ncbi:hypothetical protein B0H66DRAFT_550098 [Apodospora peruviana]|uniref:Uncharacterized protein n=1 Tax=Apodospora peruviana TaxID=516989 RepID=A0AAE0IJL3_9PEZI|nr:hypothetical protein B0H66DRAFT_550098 [Apodospora peruviana]
MAAVGTLGGQKQILVDTWIYGGVTKGCVNRVDGKNFDVSSEKWVHPGTGDSLVVTDPTTNLALTSLSRGERTGSRVFWWIWSYVKDLCSASTDISVYLVRDAPDFWLGSRRTTSPIVPSPSKRMVSRFHNRELTPWRVNLYITKRRGNKTIWMRNMLDS